jgi:hypothetical protein
MSREAGIADYGLVRTDDLLWSLEVAADAARPLRAAVAQPFPDRGCQRRALSSEASADVCVAGS